jgi:hypothetical protein
MIGSLPRPLLLALLLLPSVREFSAGEGLTLPPPPRSFGSEEAGKLESALESIRAESLSVDLHFFAADEMMGRDTPSPEQRVAARFLRSRLERVGIAPGARDGYFAPFPLFRKTLDLARTRLRIEGTGEAFDLVCGEDYFFRSRRAVFPLQLETWGIFCGDGSREDFKAAEESAGVAERWAVCFAGEGVSATRRRRNAERAGVAGLVTLPPRGGEEDPFVERYATLTRSCGIPLHVYRPGPDRERPPEGGLPELFLSRAAAERLLGASPARGTSAVESWSPKPGLPLGVRITDHREGPGLVEVENVCGFWRGSDPDLWRETIVISAHYDHIGARDGVIFNGADDNGSGSIGLLAIAESLVRYGPMRRSVLLLWVSGEEKGLWGSRAWVEDPWLPEGAHAVCNINIDMIGRNAPEHLEVTPSSRHGAYGFLTRLAEKAAGEEGFGELKSADSYWKRSDQVNFVQHLKIPAIFLFTGEHEDYHRSTDTPDKIDYDKMRRVCRLVLRLLHDLQGDELGR